MTETREDRKDLEMAEGEAKGWLAAEEWEEILLHVVQNGDMVKAEDKKENNPLSLFLGENISVEPSACMHD